MSENLENLTPQLDNEAEVVTEAQSEAAVATEEIVQDIQNEQQVELDNIDEVADEQEIELELETIDEVADNNEQVLTKAQRAKILFMQPLWSSIVKWSCIFLGIVGVVLYFIATSSRSTGESFAKIFRGVSGGIAKVFSLIPIPVFEIVICATVLGLLAYLVYIIVRTIQVKGGARKGGLWIQFGYTVLAVAGVFTLLSSMCYGVFTYRNFLSKSTPYTSAKVTNMEFSETMLYLIDGINNSLHEGSGEIFFTKNNLSRYQGKGTATAKITERVNEAFKKAAKDIPTLKGPKLSSKELLFSGVYSSFQISSIYSPITGEIGINNYYPEIVVPMQVAKTMAIQRGYTDDGDADFIAFLVLTQYTDDYYLNYSGYFNAYLSLSSQFYNTNGKDLHLYLANALVSDAKKEYVALVKELDKLYGVSSDISYVASSETISKSQACDIAKLLLVNYRDNVDAGKVRIDDTEPVDYGKFCNYLTNFYKIDDDFQDAVDEIYEEYHPN